MRQERFESFPVGIIRDRAKVYMDSTNLPLVKMAPSMDVSTECIRSIVSFGVRAFVYSGSPSVGDAEDISGWKYALA